MTKSFDEYDNKSILSNGYVIYYDDVEDHYSHAVSVDFVNKKIYIVRTITEQQSFKFLEARTIRLQLLTKVGITLGTYVFDISEEFSGYESGLNVGWMDNHSLDGSYEFVFTRHMWVPNLKDLPN